MGYLEHGLDGEVKLLTSQTSSPLREEEYCNAKSLLLTEKGRKG
jgi:hypothetical protein